MWPLIGVAIVVVGLILRLNPLLVILTSGLVTGLIADMSVVEIIEAIGSSFTQNRYMSLFILILPVVGILERYGLRERAETLIRSMKGASLTKILVGYALFRKLTNAAGLQLGGHPSMVRPLVAPMSEAAATEKRQLPSNIIMKIRAYAAASENMGNFFGQNLFIAVSSLLLIKGVMEDAGVTVSLERMALFAIPTAIVSLIVLLIRVKLFAREIDRSVPVTDAPCEEAPSAKNTLGQA